MIALLLSVMMVAATLYAVLGGADFGVALIEPFLPADVRGRASAAIAPVWEANHVWLVLLATLLFVAFPPAYAAVATYLHLPLLFVLLGIVSRGSAFVFRHYDPAEHDSGGSGRRGYTLVFRAGSVLTPLFLGITLAGTATGRIGAGGTFYEAYVAPWNTAWGWATGVFVVALFAFQGAALLSAESHEAAGPPGARQGGALPFEALARRAHGVAMVSGALVFAVGFFTERAWFDRVVHSVASVAALLLTALLVPVTALAFRRGRPWVLRGALFAQVSAILVGFFGAQYPVLVRMAKGDLTAEQAAAPAATLAGVTWAIVVGLSLIVPGMVFLVRTSKVERAPRG